MSNDNYVVITPVGDRDVLNLALSKSSVGNKLHFQERKTTQLAGNRPLSELNT